MIKRVCAARAAAILLAGMLAGCGGGGATGSPSRSVGAGAAPAADASQQLASDSASAASQAAIALQFGPPGSASAPNVPLGSSALVSAVVRSANGVVQPNVLVTFTPPAVAALNPAIGTALTDSGGVATIVVEGVAPGAGALTASATVAGTQASASVAFAVTAAGATSPAAALFGSVEFAGATKQTLNIAGTGSAATSDVSFRVRDQNGQPLAGQTVTFTPTVTTGGLTLQPTVAVSDAQGIARTTVTAGNAPTPVRIKAATAINGNTYEVQSLQLSVSSGNPSQKFFSVAAMTPNIDGCNLDGAKTSVSARAGDQFGNPVPDGTTVNFVTEGGRVGTDSIGSCQTRNGACSVELESQEFRPRNQSPAWNNCRVTVLAYAVGQETYADLNSNYRYDAGEPFEDLPDAFVNAQPLGRAATDPAYPWMAAGLPGSPAMGPVNFLPGLDTLIKFVDSGQGRPTSDAVWGNAHVRGWTEVVFSGRAARVCAVIEQAGVPTLDCGALPEANLGQCTAGRPLAADVQLAVMDQNGNPLAAGSKVSIEAGDGVTVGTLSPGEVPETSAVLGSIHTARVTFTPSGCGAAGTRTPVGSLVLKAAPVGAPEQRVRIAVAVNN